ncbi:FAD binding domain-containing protein [Geopyxis carbonaria]|nr:FAD binding domain-containing protein [Geopyxis carbonaria]
MRLTPALLAAVAAHTVAATASSCKTYPGDAGWPSERQWGALNKTVGGRLIADVPLAAVCHDGPLGAYDAAACADVQENWSKPWIHQDHPSSIMSPLFTNRTCLPTTDASVPCTLGYAPEYVLNVTSAADIQAGVNFARTHNLRLVVKNTGHDFFGKSTGFGALSLWTHHLRSVEFLDAYRGATSYRGPAARVGAGVRVTDAYHAAAAVGRVMVGGEQPTVGLAGGFTAGGGHSPLSSKYGMAADQVLELQVVTADGVLRTVSQRENADLYWAMRGGGGGVFGVVVSMVVKTHPDTPVATMPLTFASNDTDAYWQGVRAFMELSPKLTERGIYTFSAILASSFSTQPIFAPDVSVAELHKLLKPLYTKLEKLGITYNATATQHPNLLSAWEAGFNAEVTGIYSGSVSRLVPQSIFKHAHPTTSMDTFMDVFRTATDTLGYWAGFFIAPSHTVGGALSDNAVNPAWREAGLHALAGYLIPENSTAAEVAALREKYTVDVFQPVRDVTPGAGCYQSEGAYSEPNWHQAFHGSHYARLAAVKKSRDPGSLFYADKGVGSEEWTVSDGRLCKASSY